MRRPAYEAKIAAATKELCSYVDIETEARYKSEMMAAKCIGELRERADNLNALCIWLLFAVIVIGIPSAIRGYQWLYQVVTR